MKSNKTTTSTCQKRQGLGCAVLQSEFATEVIAGEGKRDSWERNVRAPEAEMRSGGQQSSSGRKVLDPRMGSSETFVLSGSASAPGLIGSPGFGSPSVDVRPSRRRDSGSLIAERRGGFSNTTWELLSAPDIPVSQVHVLA